MVLWPLLFVIHTASADPTRILVTDEKDKVGAGLSSEAPSQLYSEDIYWNEPNVGAAGGTNRSRYLQIRGVGEASSYENTPSHSIGYWINDIDLTGTVASWPTLDVSQVHLHKGPQSIHYGNFALGGVVETKLLPIEASARAKMAYETGNLKTGGISFPAFSRFRLSLHHLQGDGFYKNQFNGSSGAAQDENYAHLQVDLVDAPLWKVTSNHLGLLTNNSFDMWSLNNSYNTLSDQPGKDAQRVHGHSVKVEKTLLRNAQVTSLSSVTFSNSEFSYDADWGNNSYWQSIPGWNQPYDYFDQSVRNRMVWHEKIYYSQGPSSYGVHIYGLREKSNVDHFKNKEVNGSNDSRYESLHGALFADHRWLIDEFNELQVSGRLEKQKLRYADTDLAQTHSKDTLYAWALGHQRSWSDVLTTHIQVSRGFRGSGVNVDSALPPSDRFYRPEKLMNYEFGAEYRQDVELWSLNIFFMDQRDKQIRVSRQDDPMDPGTYIYFTNNAAQVQTHGLEARWVRDLRRWKIEMQGGWLKSRFENYIFENKSLKGRETANAPEWSYAFGLTRQWTDRFLSSISFSGKSASYFSNNHDQRSHSFSQMNLLGQYRQNRWQYDVWVKNLFDRQNEVRGFYFANEPPDWNNKLYVQYGPPRRVGGSISYVF